MELATDSSTITDVAPQKSRLRKALAILQRTWVRYAALALLGLAIHFPALPGELIWDDTFLARDNPFIRSPVLVFEAFRHHLLLDSLSMHYRPVQNMSYMLDYFFWNTDTYGFHLSNVLWHVGSGLLLFALLQRLLPGLIGPALSTNPNSENNSSKFSSLIAFFLALIWVVHPVHSAVVDYISGRADSLAFFFATAGWLLFLNAQNVSRPILRFSVYALATISALLALLSREIGCIWIALFVAHLLFIERGILFRRRFGAI